MATQTPIAEHVRKRRIALVLVDDDEAARVGELLDAPDGADAAERGQHHRIGKRQFVGLADRAVVRDFLDRHLALLDVLDAGVGDPLDMLLAHLAFEQSLGIADPVEAEMTDIGFGCHKGHGDAVAELAAAQFGFQDEQELVGRAETGCALHRADHDRPRIGGELLEGFLRVRGVIDVADRLRMAVGPEPRNLVEGEFRPGRDHQIIVVDRAAVGKFDTVFRRMHARRALGQQADALLLHDVDEVDLDIGPLAPADRDPGIGRDEVIDRPLRNHREAVVLPQLRQQFIGHQRSAEAGSDNNNFRHGRLRMMHCFDGRLRQLKLGCSSRDA